MATPVVFVHGLWLLPNSWDRWAAVFKKAGYTTLTPGWPDDPYSVASSNFNPWSEAKVNLTIGSGWRKVCDTALGFVRRYV